MNLGSITRPPGVPMRTASLAGRAVLTAAVLTATALTSVAVGPGASRGLAAPAPDPATVTASGGPYSGVVPEGSCFVVARVTGGAGGHNLVGGGISHPNANGAAA